MNTATALSFADLEAQDPVFGYLHQPTPAARVQPVVANTFTPGAAGRFTEKCPKCRGSGRFVSYSGRDVGPCHNCKGAGQLTFKNSQQDRTRARELSAARKVKKAAQSWDFFAEAEPAIAAWLMAASARGFEFAASVKEKVAKYGELTEGQRVAIEKCMVRDAERDVQRAAQKQQDEVRRAAAPACDCAKLAESMRHAKNAGLKYVRLDLGRLTFTLAPDHGKNPGAIYVTLGYKGQYLGKVINGKFEASRECTPELSTEILAVCADPHAAAVLHGKQTGRCSCCQRELTNPESILLGIGPICRGKFGW